MYGLNCLPLVAVLWSANGPLFTLSTPILTDVDLIFDNLDSSLFPGVSSSVKVHDGFGEAHEQCVLSPR